MLEDETRTVQHAGVTSDHLMGFPYHITKGTPVPGKEAKGESSKSARLIFDY